MKEPKLRLGLTAGAHRILRDDKPSVTIGRFTKPVDEKDEIHIPGLSFYAKIGRILDVDGSPFSMHGTNQPAFIEIGNSIRCLFCGDVLRISQLNTIEPQVSFPTKTMYVSILSKYYGGIPHLGPNAVSNIEAGVICMPCSGPGHFYAFCDSSDCRVTRADIGEKDRNGEANPWPKKGPWDKLFALKHGEGENIADGMNLSHVMRMVEKDPPVQLAEILNLLPDGFEWDVEPTKNLAIEIIAFVNEHMKIKPEGTTENATEAAQPDSREATAPDPQPGGHSEPRSHGAEDSD